MLVLEIAGILLAASTVRMVAGAGAGLLSLLTVGVARVCAAEPHKADVFACVALLMWVLVTRASVLVAGIVSLVLLSFGCWWEYAHASWGPIAGAYFWVLAALALPSLWWFTTALKGRDGRVTGFTGLALASLSLDANAACALLTANSTAMLWLVWRSYRIKRYA